MFVSLDIHDLSIFSIINLGSDKFFTTLWMHIFLKIVIISNKDRLIQTWQMLNAHMHLIPRKCKIEDILAEIFGSESDNIIN